MSYDQALRARELFAGPDQPIVVTSSAVIEPRVMSLLCPHCRGEYRILEHTRPRHGVRRVDAQCRHCSTLRTLWFRLVDFDAN